MKTTKWFPGNIKPVRVGVYLRKYPHGVSRYCWWDNGWGTADNNPFWAKLSRGIRSEYQNLQWRGLAQEPKQ